jgi:hypothetical protein
MKPKSIKVIQSELTIEEQSKLMGGAAAKLKTVTCTGKKKLAAQVF